MLHRKMNNPNKITDQRPQPELLSCTGLEAKSSRLYALAQAAGCAITNLSPGFTRLVCPQQDYRGPVPKPFKVDQSAMTAALDRETELFNINALTALDEMWLNTVRHPVKFETSPI